MKTRYENYRPGTQLEAGEPAHTGFDKLQKRSTGILISAICLFASIGPASSQTISTFAGNGSTTFCGDGGQATAACLNHPSGLTVDAGNSVYIADTDNFRIRRVTAGTIVTAGGNGVSGPAGDGGQAVNASFSDVHGLAADSGGNIYVADSSNRRVRKIAANGIVTTIAGTGVQGFSGDGGPATSATLNVAFGVALDGAGNLYICDSSNHNIRKVNLSTGTITTYAGNGIAAFSGDGGQAAAASLNFPLGVAADRSGNLFIADAGNNAIRKVTAAGVITTVAGRGGSAGFSGDGGFATNALLNIPSAVAIDGAGNLFISDSGNNRVRRVDASSQVITTIAGGDANAFGGDGGPAVGAFLSFPTGAAIDSTGALYIADRSNSRVRRITGVASGALPLPAPTVTAPPSSTPQVTSLTPAAATGNAQQHYVLQIDDASGFQDLDIVNMLVNQYLDGAHACYLAYSRSANTLFLVNDAGTALLPGLVMNGSGSLSNSQCTISGAGSSAVGSGNTLTLTLNITFSATFGGDKVIYAAGRTPTLNSGWKTMGVVGVPPLPSTFPNAISVSPPSGKAPSAIFSFTYQDANSANNLQTAWALINAPSLDGRSACYIVYYRPGNQVLLFPDNGDATQAATMTLTGSNTVSNSQCIVSAQGSSVAINGTQMVVTLNVAFQPAFSGSKAIWMAVQTIGGAQTSAWRALGAWQVP